MEYDVGEYRQGSAMTSAVWFFLRRHLGLYTALAAILLVAAVLEAISVGALFPLMTAVLGGGSGSGGGRVLLAMQEASQIVPGEDRVLATVILLVGAITLKSLTTVWRDYLIASGGAKVVYGIKQEIFHRFSRSSYHYFLNHRQGDLSYRLTTAPQSLGLMLLLLPSSAAQALIVVSICILLATINWQLTVGIIGFGAILYALLRQVARRISHVAGKRRTAALSRELGVVMEFFAGIKEILAAQAANRWAHAYEREGEELRRVHVKDSVWQSLPGVVIEWVFFVMIGVLAVKSQAAVGEAGGQGAVPMMAVFAYALYRLIRAVSILSQYKLRLSGQLADVELLYQALHESLPALLEGHDTKVRFEDAIQFERVSFVYPGRSEYAIREVSLRLPKGKTTALVGQIGAGKTTLVNLLLRLYDPTEGILRVDGRDLGEYRRDAWLKLVGYVSQEVFILNGTVAENIRFGLDNFQDSEVIAAVQAAHAHNFVLSLPNGYQTVVGDRGMTLSGGQRQCLAIARALLRKPEILIFDEATSQLDNVSEALIQKAIAELARDHTLVLVAHRLSTVRFADQIVVLDRGRVVEVGNHEELLARKGQYSLMMASSGE